MFPQFDSRITFSTLELGPPFCYYFPFLRWCEKLGSICRVWSALRVWGGCTEGMMGGHWAQRSPRVSISVSERQECTQRREPSHVLRTRHAILGSHILIYTVIRSTRAWEECRAVRARLGAPLLLLLQLQLLQLYTLYTAITLWVLARGWEHFLFKKPIFPKIQHSIVVSYNLDWV